MPYLTTIAVILDASAYRVRGGGWFKFSSDFPCRQIWCASLLFSYLITHASSPCWPYVAALPLLTYGSLVIVNHSYCDNMGRWATPQKEWPSFWLPTLLDAEWTGMHSFFRTAYDFASMASVGFFRALMIFLPFIASRWFQNGGLDYIGVVRAASILTIGQPIAYLIGWYVPLNFPSLEARGTEWGELFNGAVWGIAMGQI